MGRVRAARICSGLVAASLASLIFAATAGANPQHVFAYSFSGTGAATLDDGTGIAVDNSAGPSKGDVYVADYGGHRIEKFNAAGSFLLAFGVPDYPAFVAVDSSSGPSAGDVYVAEWEPTRVRKFDPSGNPIASWGEGGKLAFPRLAGGIAVGPDGTLFVQSGWGDEATILAYDQGGSPISNFVLQRPSPGNGIAVDGTGNLYVTSRLGIESYDSSGSELGVVDGTTEPGAIAIDRSAGRVYVKHLAGSIDEFSAGCTAGICVPEATFGREYFGSNSDLLGIAVNQDSGTVYTADYEYESNKPSRIAVFYPPGVLVQATTFQSDSIEDDSARVSGQVDPAGAEPVLECRFEYVTEAEYRSGGYDGASSAPCAPVPGDMTPTDVSATLTDLAQDTSYRYRLVAANPNGESPGVTRRFRTAPSLPQVVTGGVSNLQPESATASGSVDMGGGTAILGCYFQYVSAASFAVKGYAEAEIAPCIVPHGFSKTTDVSEGLEHLGPSTTYRYRLVAWNSKGLGYGQDREFTTSAKPVPEPEEPEEGEPRPHPHPRHVRCTRNACAHKLRGSDEPHTWTSPIFPASYAWEAAVQSHGRWMPHTQLVGGCVATFRTEDLVVRLNGCHGHVRVRYVGEGTFTVVWQIFR